MSLSYCPFCLLPYVAVVIAMSATFAAYRPIQHPLTQAVLLGMTLLAVLATSFFGYVRNNYEHYDRSCTNCMESNTILQQATFQCVIAGFHTARIFMGVV